MDLVGPEWAGSWELQGEALEVFREWAQRKYVEMVQRGIITTEIVVNRA